MQFHNAGGAMNAPDPSPASPLKPYGLVSLLDMLKYYARPFLALGEKIGEVRSYLVDFENDRAKEPDIEVDKEYLLKHLEELESLCIALDLDVSTNHVQGYREKKWMPEKIDEYNMLINCIDSEIGSKRLFYIEKEKSKYYDCDDWLSYETASVFPLASHELIKASDCYALDQNTACVYHCMRALERGLRALAAEVGVAWSVQQWHVAINEIEKAIKLLGNSLPAGQAKSERMQFLSEAAKEFSYFKDAWRNYAAHAHATYDSGKALKVRNHVCDFFEVISRHLKE